MITQENIPYTADEIKAMAKTCEKYNKAREKARELMNKGYDVLMPEIFPELNENEDEKIKREIVAYINELADLKNEKIPTKWLAWLEKQKNYIKLPNSAYTSNKDVNEFADTYSHDVWEKLMDNFKKIENYSIGCNDVSDIVLNAIINTYIWLERQGEKKDFTFKSIPRLLEMVPPTDKAKSYCEKLRDSLQAEGYHTDSKIVGEHLKHMNGEAIAVVTSDENVDKPESKFKVGDWFVNNNRKDVFLIKSINTNGYCALEDIKGNIISPCLPPCESDSHIWTIEDAKDGDVLTNGEFIVIFKQIIEPKHRQHIEAYIGLDLGANIQITSKSWLLGIDKAMPATKEQRELLSQKMKEAGYEWDGNKKELKKMEIKSKNFEPKKLDADKVIAWLVANICDYEYYVKWFKKDFGL